MDAAKYAPILCAGVTVFNAIRKMNIPPGATVGVQGLGGLGHLAIQYASKLGYRVVALSRDSKKEKFARELGADEYIDASTVDTAEALQKLGGASLIVATAPNADAITPLLKGLGILGKLLILSGKSFPCTCIVLEAILIRRSSSGRDFGRYSCNGTRSNIKGRSTSLTDDTLASLRAFCAILAQWACSRFGRGDRIRRAQED